MSGARSVLPSGTGQVEVRATARLNGGRPAQRSLVRTAVALLVQSPALAAEIEPPWTFSELRQPGIPLLVELIRLCRERPTLTTGALLEQFAEREEAAALNKLATLDLLVDAGQGRADFIGALAQLDVQTSQQRLDDLKSRELKDLSLSERNELRQLLTGKPAHRKR